MTFTLQTAQALAADLISDIHPRWEHLQAVGRRAEDLAASAGLGEEVVMAAWVHDVGYSAVIARAGFHPLDGARFLESVGAPVGVVRLVAWHTGAGFEAAARGLLGELEAVPRPDPMALDALTMIDLATSPTGEAVLASDRITEILSRYEVGHPVYEAVSESCPSLLAASRRAKAALGLSQSWPVCW